MSIYEHWEKEKEPLRQLLGAQTNLSDSVYQIRHALVQTEQNALAEMENDVVRQQAGILMGCVKGSLSLCEVNVASQTWVAQKAETPEDIRKTWQPLALAALQAATILLAYFQGQWIYMLLAIASTILGAFVLKKPPKKAGEIPQNQVSVTIKPDIDKLLSELDKQIRLVDRSLNDFRYLNEQTGAATECADDVSVARAADLMETIWESGDEEARLLLEDAAKNMLRQLGMTVVSYDKENRGYFNVLPGKKQTRTISPALLSAKDAHLLRRGTAVVCEADRESF